MKLVLGTCILVSTLTAVAVAAPVRPAIAGPRYYVRDRSASLPVVGVDSPDRSLTVSIGRGEPTSTDGDGAQIVWLTNNRTKQRRQLLVSRYSSNFERNLTGLSNPLFSLDGGYVYVSSNDAGPGSGVVHQLKVSTGSERAVAPGAALAVIRTDRTAAICSFSSIDITTVQRADRTIQCA